MRFISRYPKHYTEERNYIDVNGQIDSDGHLSIDSVDSNNSSHTCIYIDEEDLDNLIKHLAEIRVNFPNG